MFWVKHVRVLRKVVHVLGKHVRVFYKSSNKEQGGM